MARGFASDNNSGIHPEVLAAIARVNEGHMLAYGGDPVTERAVAAFRREFGGEVDVYFVFNGTAANVLGLQAMTRPHHAVICSEQAHIQLDECGAPERFTGCKLIPLKSYDGKIRVEDLRAALKGLGDQHHVQPKVVSVAQATEFGTVYAPGELKAISEFARENGLYFHIDGARISNAAASLGVSLKEAAQGADILSFGGTKNGLMGAEAIVILNPALRDDFLYIRKQGMQLASKMRFLSAQFEVLLTDQLGMRSARHANSMAQLLAELLKSIPEIKILNSVQANAVFAEVPPALIAPLQREFYFYVWDASRNWVRWMTSFDTTESDVREFVKAMRKILKN